MTQRPVKLSKPEKVPISKNVPKTLPKSERKVFGVSVRLAGLIGALIVLLVFALVFKSNALRQKWLESHTAAELKQTAQSSSDPLTHLIYAERLLEKGDTGDALSELETAQSHLPTDAADSTARSVGAYRGYLLSKRGDARQAVPLLEKMRGLDDSDPIIFLGLGQILEHEGRLDGAQAQYNLAVGLDPKSAEAWYCLGANGNRRRKPEEAVDALRRAVALQPGNPVFRAELGHAYAYQRQYAEAADQFRHAVRLDPKSDDYSLFLGAALGSSARTPEEYKDAVQRLDAGLKNDPTNHTLHYTLGALLLRFDNLPEAQQHLKQSVAISPSFADGWYSLSQAERRLGHIEAARAAQAHFQSLSQLENDQRTLEKRVQVAPDDTGLRLKLAKCYARQGNLVGAADQCRSALTIQPGNLSAGTLLRDISAVMDRLRRERHLSNAQMGALGPPLSGAGSDITVDTTVEKPVR